MYYSEKTLEFDKIKNMLCSYVMTEAAKEKCRILQPSLIEKEVHLRTLETTQARTLVDIYGIPPLTAMKDIHMVLETAEKGGRLSPEELSYIVAFLSACRQLKRYLKKTETTGNILSSYGNALDALSDLTEEINRCIHNGAVDDNASPPLRDVRRKMETVKGQIKEKLDSILKSKKQYFSDGYVSKRSGHFVLPVKKEYKHQVPGSVIDTSATGSTYFIEPSAVIKLQGELSILQANESREEDIILYTLSSFVADYAPVMKLNMETIETLDFIFAKAKLSVAMVAVPATINTKGILVIDGGRHPLLPKEDCVPLNFVLGEGTKGIVITGPNTGGKTVALKTVGLLSIMAQSGLHIPCQSANICMRNAYLCDIGDGQSITESLSTFSAHIKNIISIISQASAESLILLDELGSGTDPAEGMGIAIAVLEELRLKKCLFIATTHYPEVKEYAAQSSEITNARMAFDRETLSPLYRLEIGEAGESCALYIAKRLGLPRHMLTRAQKIAYSNKPIGQVSNMDSHLLDGAIDTGIGTASPKIVAEKEPLPPGHTKSFCIGDSVVVMPQKKIGIVFREADDKGNVGVQIQKEKQLINHKRLTLKAPASELYPPDYDFSILFDTVENRKARHQMEKGHRKDLSITIKNDWR